MSRSTRLTAVVTLTLVSLFSVPVAAVAQQPTHLKSTQFEACC